MTKSEEKSRRILVVDDDKETSDLIAQALSGRGMVISTAADGESALHRLKAWRPHLVLLDVQLPGCTGISLLPKIRQATVDEYVPVVLVSADMAVEDVEKGLEAGADDYLTKPFRVQELLGRVRAMSRLRELHDNYRRASRRIEELITTDELTGLLNLRALSRKIEDEISRTRRFGKPLSVLLVDVDGFSEINDAGGFSFGDGVLRAAGGQIRSAVRSIDSLGRAGSDEFVVLLPETDLAGAQKAAERIAAAVKKAEIRAEQRAVHMTVCVGIAGMMAAAREVTSSDLLREAREALRSAKSGGRDRIEIYSFV